MILDNIQKLSLVLLHNVYFYYLCVITHGDFTGLLDFFFNILNVQTVFDASITNTDSF